MGYTFDRDAYERRIRWWQHDRFGIFIHWGLYALHGRGEWAACEEETPADVYERWAERFRPRDYDPGAWARAAREAGARYVVLTAKHHEGFCLWDTATTRFSSPHTPLGRDVVRDFLDAARSEGLKVGLYYSLLDWHHPDYPHFGDKTHPERNNPAAANDQRDFGRYLAYMHEQVRELCSNYGKLDLLWFDFSYGELRGEAWRATELMDMVRRLQPGILVNNRLEVSGKGVCSLAAGKPLPYHGDFITPEQVLPPAQPHDAYGRPLAWEACITMNDDWGYNATDDRYKSATMLTRTLVECVSRGGNMMLNIGPNGQGAIPRPQYDILHAIGGWLLKHGESIYGCTSTAAGPEAAVPTEWGHGRVTRRGATYYYHLFENSIGPVHLPGIAPERIAHMRRLDDGTEVPLARNRLLANYPGTAFACLGPTYVSGAAGAAAALPDPVDTVIEVELREPPLA